MRKIKFYQKIKIYDQFYKREASGYLLEEGVALHTSYEYKRGWEITDLATGLLIINKPHNDHFTKDVAIERFNKLKEKYEAIKLTNTYKKLTEELGNLPVMLGWMNENEIK